MAVSKRISFAILLVVFTALFAAAQQADQGTITGVITDPSGALVPGTKVTARNMATSLERSATTGQAGQYTIPFLPQGNYVLTAEASGFQTYVQSGITVPIGTTLTVNVQLTLGQAVQQVSVTAQAPLLEKEDAELGTVVSNETYRNLPVAVSGGRRDPVAFIFLAPGVTGSSFSTQINGGESFSREIWVGGAPTAPMELQGDFRSITYSMSVDAVNEFKLATNNYATDLGRASGVMTYTLKAGTNSLHGTVYEFLRNTATDSRGFFASSVPTDIQNEFGGNVGGPVVIPKLYNGRNKTFFFFDFNAYRHKMGSPQNLVTVPTQAMLNGDFSAPGAGPIYDPATTRALPDGAVTRDRFQCNGVLDVICPDRFSSVANNFLPLIPTAELPGAVSNYRAKVPGTPFYHQTSYTMRFDESVSDRQTWSFSLQHGVNHSSLGSPFGIIGPLNSARFGPVSETLVRLSNTYMFRPNLVNHFTFGYNRDPQATIDPEAGTDWATRLGIAGINRLENTMPSVQFDTNSFAPFHQTANTQGFNIVPNSYVYEEQLIWSKGKHTFKFGADLRWQGENFQLDAGTADFHFSNLETGLPGSPGTGNSFASFLLGTVDNANMNLNAFGETGDRVRYFAGYAQDDVKLTPKLTLNLGLRYEVPLPEIEVHNKLTSFDPTIPNPGAGNIPGALSFAGFGPGKCNCRRFLPIDYKEFGPHVGVAYQLTSKTVIRGGYGIAYNGGGPFGGGAQRGIAQGWQASALEPSPDGGITPAFNWDSGFPQNFTYPPLLIPEFANNGGANWYVRDLNKAPYYQSWNVNVQQELKPSLLLSVAYAASKGTRLPTGVFNPNQTPSRYLALGSLLGADINSPAAQAAIAAGTIPGPPYAGFAGTVSQSLRPYPQYVGLSVLNPFLGNSTYNALQVEMKKRYSNGLSFLVSYTASKTLDDSGSLFGGFFGSSGRDNDNRRIEKSWSVNDVPQNLVISYVYELPFGKNKPYLKAGGPLGKLVEGWQVSGIHIYRRGLPLSITVNDTLNIFNQQNNPNRVAGVSPRSGASLSSLNIFGGPASYINAAAFAEPGPFTIGNGPRTYGDLRQPAFFNEDFAITKRTYFHEQANIEFRWEMFNMFNRHVFSVGGTNFSDPASFGKIYGQANGARQMQASLRINF